MTIWYAVLLLWNFYYSNCVFFPASLSLDRPFMCYEGTNDEKRTRVAINIKRAQLVLCSARCHGNGRRLCSRARHHHLLDDDFLKSRLLSHSTFGGGEDPLPFFPHWCWVDVKRLLSSSGDHHGIRIDNFRSSHLDPSKDPPLIVLSIINIFFSTFCLL